jgi:hypothetical protein
MHPEPDHAQLLALRRQARAARQAADDGLRERHRQVVAALLDPDRAAQVRERALRQVEKWERGRLCHPRYADAWRAILGLPSADLPAAILRDDPQGASLRQNSPFGFLLGSGV